MALESEFTVYLMVGIPGSGKSTYIKNNFPELPVVSRDIIRSELGFTESADQKAVLTPEQERQVTDVEYQKMTALCRRKQNFVVDDTNTGRFRKGLIDFLKNNGAKVVGISMNTPLEACTERRKGQIPADVMHNIYKRYIPLNKNEVDDFLSINESKTNNNMKKNSIKLNETQLCSIIAESVKSVLKEEEGPFGPTPEEIERVKRQQEEFSKQITDKESKYIRSANGWSGKLGRHNDIQALHWLGWTLDEVESQPENVQKQIWQDLRDCNLHRSSYKDSKFFKEFGAPYQAQDGEAEALMGTSKLQEAQLRKVISESVKKSLEEISLKGPSNEELIGLLEKWAPFVEDVALAFAHGKESSLDAREVYSTLWSVSAALNGYANILKKHPEL